MKLPDDFREFIELMIAGNVEFVMIGGYAYNLYRNPRATGDIDFFVATDADNQQRLRSVLTNFGFGETLPPAAQELIQDDQVLMLGRSPFRIDLLAEIDGVSFEEVSETKRLIEIDGLSVPVISPEMLLKNKSSTGRPKDAADAIELQTWLTSKE